MTNESAALMEAAVSNLDAAKDLTNASLSQEILGQDERTLLIIDDDSIDREAIRRLLGDQFDIHEAETACDGRHFCEAGNPSCVLLDQNLPDAKGIDLVNFFTEQDIPVVMLTGQDNVDLAVRAIQGGAQNFLTKNTLSAGELVETIMIAIHDVKEKKARAEWLREKDELIEKLTTALAENQTLNGLIPICAGCKSIRDDEGYWQRVEDYISNRSTAEFTHGTCDKCLAVIEKDIEASRKRKNALKK